MTEVERIIRLHQIHGSMRAFESKIIIEDGKGNFIEWSPRPIMLIPSGQLSCTYAELGV